MPRIRSISPAFWNDEKLAQEAEGIMLTFIGTWNYADDYGVVKANALWLKNQIFPYKEKLRIDVFTTWLNRLEELEVVIPVVHRGESFYYIRTFRKYQKVDRPSKARNIPEEILVGVLKGKGFIFSEDGELVEHSTSVLDDSSTRTRETFAKEGEGEGEREETLRGTPPAQMSLKDYGKISKDKSSISNFIRENHPVFIDPYADLWNLFAEGRSLAKVKSVTDTRRKKLGVRIREKPFDFLAILKKANASEFLLSSKWFGFDWIIENDSNYLKVIEGNYDKGKPQKEVPVTETPSGPQYKRI